MFKRIRLLFFSYQQKKPPAFDERVAEYPKLNIRKTVHTASLRQHDLDQVQRVKKSHFFLSFSLKAPLAEMYGSIKLIVQS
jgi:hypothetical protein